MAYRRRYYRTTTTTTTTAPSGKRSEHFNSSRAYLAWCQKQSTTNNRFYHNQALGDLRSKVDHGIALLEQGDESLVAKAMELINHFQQAIPTPKPEWRRAYVGVAPIVPAYISNAPNCMLARTKKLVTHTPIRIFVGVTSSWGITYEQLMQRGCALAAFAIALSQHRPVYLTPYVQLGARFSAYVSWDLQTSPLILSEVLASLANPDVIRHLGIAACYALGGSDGAWPSDYENEQSMRINLACKPDDVYLGSIHLNDPLLTNPIQWIKDNLAKYTQGEVAA